MFGTSKGYQVVRPTCIFPKTKRPVNSADLIMKSQHNVTNEIRSHPGYGRTQLFAAQILYSQRVGILETDKPGASGYLEEAILYFLQTEGNAIQTTNHC